MTTVPRSRSTLLVLFAILATLMPGVHAEQGDASQRLQALFEDNWERRMRENPVWASRLGDRRHDDRWPDRSIAAIEASHRADVADLERLRRIDPADLPESDRLDHELFEHELVEDIEAHGFRRWLQPVSHRGGVHTLDSVGDRIRMRTVQDHENWLARLEALPELIEQTRILMQKGVDEDIVPPEVILERVPRQIRDQIVDQAEESPFWKRFEDLPDVIAEDVAASLRSRARRVIMDELVPAYRDFTEFFEQSYLPQAPEAIGVSARPRGGDYYEHLARRYTTTDLTPEEIHRIGLDEVERIRAEMEAVIEEVGFDGDFDAFLEFLRTDPQFYFDDPQELLEAYRATAKRIDPEMVHLFGRLPRIPYGVIPIPETTAPDTTTAYYTRPAADGSRAGYYYVNLYRPEVRPKYEIEVLTVHEAVPGHHMQIALAMELEDQPQFRRYGGFTAFTEGWGLYSERLGHEIGLYQDSYSRFGALTYDMWRAVRLVVDTGMHYLGWSRERAIEYFDANAAKTRHDIVNEIDRYLDTPGQALAYKIGQIRISTLRERATEALGADFDVREFHDLVLSRGSVPLNTLEAMVDEWLAGRAAPQD
jgi:prolyl oligopeptidase